MRAKKILLTRYSRPQDPPRYSRPLPWPRSDPEPIWFLKLGVGVLNFDMAVFDASFGGEWGKVGKMWGKVGEMWVFFYIESLF